MVIGTVAVVGSLNADLVVRVPRFPAAGETLTGTSFSRFPGGKGANQAYAAARLGASSVMIGQVGDDDLGRWLTTRLAEACVEVSRVAAVRDGTGLALITIDTSGQNQIVLVPGANGAFTPDRLPEISGWGTGLSAAAAVVQSARLASVDPNAGIGLELQAIAAVVIGGTSLMGGRGSVLKTAFGVAIIAVLGAGLAQVGVQEPTRRLVTGSVIVGSAVLDYYRTRRGRW